MTRECRVCKNEFRRIAFNAVSPSFFGHGGKILALAVWEYFSKILLLIETYPTGTMLLMWFKG